MKKIRYTLFVALAALTLLLPVIFSTLDRRFSTSGVETAQPFPEITGNALLNGEAQTQFEQQLQHER